MALLNRKLLRPPAGELHNMLRFRLFKNYFYTWPLTVVWKLLCTLKSLFLLLLPCFLESYDGWSNLSPNILTWVTAEDTSSSNGILCTEANTSTIASSNLKRRN